MGYAIIQVMAYPFKNEFLVHPEVERGGDWGKTTRVIDNMMPLMRTSNGYFYGEPVILEGLKSEYLRLNAIVAGDLGADYSRISRSLLSTELFREVENGESVSCGIYLRLYDADEREGFGDTLIITVTPYQETLKVQGSQKVFSLNTGGNYVTELITAVAEAYTAAGVSERIRGAFQFNRAMYLASQHYNAGEVDYLDEFARLFKDLYRVPVVDIEVCGYEKSTYGSDVFNLYINLSDGSERKAQIYWDGSTSTGDPMGAFYIRFVQDRAPRVVQINHLISRVVLDTIDRGVLQHQ